MEINPAPLGEKRFLFLLKLNYERTYFKALKFGFNWIHCRNQFINALCAISDGG